MTSQSAQPRLHPGRARYTRSTTTTSPPNEGSPALRVAQVAGGRKLLFINRRGQGTSGALQLLAGRLPVVAARSQDMAQRLTRGLILRGLIGLISANCVGGPIPRHLRPAGPRAAE